MATIAFMIGGAIVNALAFTGGNYVFSLLAKQNADEERIRHDKALENYQNAQADYSKKRQERLDYLNEKIRAEIHADRTYDDVDQAMQEYFIITGGDTKDVPDIGNQPTIQEYYEPSDEQKKYELLFMGGGLLLTGITAFKII
jgi:hypothetical protein